MTCPINHIQFLFCYFTVLRRWNSSHKTGLVNKWLQIMQSINSRGTCKYQAVRSKWTPLVCSDQSLWIPPTLTTCWSAVSSYSINNSQDGTCHKEAVIKVVELTGVHCNLLGSLSLNAILHINSHFITGKITEVYLEMSSCMRTWKISSLHNVNLNPLIYHWYVFKALINDLYLTAI